MRFALNFNNCMSDVIGVEHGFRHEEIDAFSSRAIEIHKNLQERRKTDIGFYNLPYDEKLLKDVLSLSKELAGGFDTLVVLGIGGSSLGAKAIFNALRHPYHNLLPGEKRKGLKIFFCDNIDPDSFKSLLDTVNLKKAIFNVITKSGETAETVAQF
ncbi:MAG: glucose-6-phosphate isomerase, partial [Deltaproteobacteria bacterium]|nr:glucose-6-phosphate isomerase [Deltaproteobacteria bacterium]